jgi:hypothetical protein
MVFQLMDLQSMDIPLMDLQLCAYLGLTLMVAVMGLFVRMRLFFNGAISTNCKPCFTLFC